MQIGTKREPPFSQTEAITLSSRITINLQFGNDLKTQIQKLERIHAHIILRVAHCAWTTVTIFLCSKHLVTVDATLLLLVYCKITVYCVA
jgi:hypothetical protein